MGRIVETRVQPTLGLTTARDQADGRMGEGAWSGGTRANGSFSPTVRVDPVRVRDKLDKTAGYFGSSTKYPMNKLHLSR